MSNKEKAKKEKEAKLYKGKEAKAAKPKKEKKPKVVKDEAFRFAAAKEDIMAALGALEKNDAKGVEHALLQARYQMIKVYRGECEVKA